MKSSKDIEPRVGMQVSIYGGSPKRISRVDYTEVCAIYTDDNSRWYGPGQMDKCYWNEGDIEIEWIPPTDEERKMFVEVAEHITFDNQVSPCDERCDAFNSCFGHFRRKAPFMLYGEGGFGKDIALSLALDGADYDNMPPGFE